MVDLDDLFGAGAELGRDVVVKAQLRFRVHPLRNPAAQAAVDQLVSAYGACVDDAIAEISTFIQHAVCAPNDQPLVVMTATPVGGSVTKSEQQPYQPGSRGGKWYRDQQGHIRYGEPPQGQFRGNETLATTPMEHVDHYRPRPFMGGYGNDRNLTAFLMEHGGNHGFSTGDLRFLGAWYGDGVSGGALFDAFLDCTGLTRDDLKGGVIHLRFGSQKLTYEEAVFEFFAAQGALFMGEEPTSPEQVEEWHEILNDEIKPLIDCVFIKYEEVKDDAPLQQRFASEPDRQRRRFYDSARRCGDVTLDLAGQVTGGWEPQKQVGATIAGMRALGLFASRARAEHHAGIHGRPHLRDSVMVDGRLLADSRDNPLLGDHGRLTSLSASQLMLLYVAAELNRRWDPHTRSFSSEKQDEIGEGELGEAVLGALAEKSPEWESASDLARGRLQELVGHVVMQLNSVNSREGLPKTKIGR